MPNRRLFQYEKLPFSLKMSAPFILMFFIFWVVGSLAIGRYFSVKLAQQQRQQLEESAALVKQNLEKELFNLRRSVRLLATNQPILDGIEQQDRGLIQRELLPLVPALETDAVQVIDADANTLLDSRRRVLREVTINLQTTLELLRIGAGVSTIAGTGELSPPILVGTTPVKNEEGVIGGIVLGVVFDSHYLKVISQSIEGHLVVLYEGAEIASTLDANAIVPRGLFDSTISAHRDSVVLQGQSFFTQHIDLSEMSNEPFDMVLLLPQTSLRASQRALWIFIGVVAAIGTLLTTVIGAWLARKLTTPIKELSETALQVVKDNDFDLRSHIDTKDEIGTLSTSLNQLIQWVGEYTHELQLSAQTLEARVEERTQSLTEALAELQETQSQLIQTEKMSSLGQMVAGIAHEINNPITFIQGNLRPLEQYFQELLELVEAYRIEYPNATDAIIEKEEDLDIEFILEDLTKLMTSMKMGTQRVCDIVVSLRNFSRLDEAAIKDVDLCEGLDSTLLILNHRIKQGVKIVKDYSSLPPVKCAPAQLNQVFTNIIANALDALFETKTEPKQITIATCVSKSDTVQVRIKDNGPGMPPAVKAKIFDPFFTTKAVGKGTGLGLGICFKIIEQHQGTIEVISEVGQGTEFLITLPTDTSLSEQETTQAA